MINAHALLETLNQLRTLGTDNVQAPGDGTPARDMEGWLRSSLAGLPLQQHADAAGSQWFSLQGASDRAVLLGCHPAAWSRGDLDASLGLAVAVETLKALALRTENKPPATITLVSWAGNAAAGLKADAPELQQAAAYLELHMEHGSALREADAALGVATSVSFPLGPMQTDTSRSTAVETVTFHPRLMALCDEAIRELTGTTAALPTAEVEDVAPVARTGVPTGIMLVQALDTHEGEAPRDEDRLHLQQAAEAFGRWAEATMHWVAGDSSDLWAREHRIPHTEAH